jgi:VIT1/CCC1 family predicted Fe2+/Mn2+ transporter
MQERTGLGSAAMSSAPRIQHHRHRDVAGGSFRAAVFGVSDGLVSNVSLILGVAGADTSRSPVVIAGFAGMIAGAVSMAAGEYVSMSAQRELLQREVAIEARALREEPDVELEELTQLFVKRGIDLPTAARVARELSADPDVALEVHAKEELGVAPDAGGSPIGAAASSFASFCLGAFVPLVPWLFGSGAAAVVASLVVSTLLAIAVGTSLAVFTRRPVVRSAARQVALTLVACAVTSLVGSIVGTAVG